MQRTFLGWFRNATKPAWLVGRGGSRLVLGLLVFVLTGLCALASNPRRSAVVEVVERVRGAVVNIHSERTSKAIQFDDLQSTLLPAQHRINGMGTGIIVDPRGYIVTNQHVVDDVQVIRVRLSDGSSYAGRIVARESEADLALIKIDAPTALPTMPMGTASDLMVGEAVIAIGNAFGYEHTVSVGVVSAVKRDVTLNKDISYKSLIQTDASINPGNSGGPLLNVNGELVGVNVAIRAGAQGIGFAIPVDTMIRVVAHMMNGRKKTGAAHGLIGRDHVESALDRASNGSETVAAKPGNWQTRRELHLERVEALSPAAKAGLQRGDVVLRVGEQPIACTLDLARAFLERPTGEKIAVAVRRADGEHRLEMVLGAERAAAPPPDIIWQKLGVRLQPVPAETITRTNRQLHGGVLVAEVSPQGAAAKAGIQRGDVLVGLHLWETLTPDNVAFVLTHDELATFMPLRFFLVRTGQIHRGWFQQLD